MVPQKKPVLVGTVSEGPVLVQHRGTRHWSVTLNGRRIDAGMTRRTAVQHAVRYINDNEGKLSK